MLNFVQVEVVLVIVVGAFVAVQIVLELRLQTTVGGFGSQHIPVLTRIGAGPHRADGAVSQRNKGRRTGLHHQHKQDAGQSQQTAYGMAFDKAHRPGASFSVVTAVFPAAWAPYLAASFACFWYRLRSRRFCQNRDKAFLESSGCSWAAV